MENKILVAAPNSHHKNYIAEEYFSLIRNLTHPNYDIFIADNSPNNANKDLYEQLGIKYQWNDPKGKSSYHFIWESQNNIRNYFLDNPEYTHLCFWETDILADPGILEYLTAYKVPVVGIPYFIYKGSDTILMNQQLDIYFTGGETRNYSLEESFRFMNGRLKFAYSIGFGLVMIERYVVAHFPFRYTPDQYVRNSDKGPAHADSFWYADLFMSGMDVCLDTSRIAEHRNQDWMKIDVNN
jgi:hypothetical protein